MLEEYKELLVSLDEMQEAITIAEQVNKKYDELKKEIKRQMVKVGQENNLEQIKWTTPNGTKITLTLGHCAEIEHETIKVFSEDKLKEQYPQIYEECLIERQKEKVIKNATSDTLRITLAKGDK